jgi:hypothetical protein
MRLKLSIPVVAICLALISGPAFAAVWIVDDDGGEDFTTIQAAVNAAGDGDLIIVKPGYYYETVVIPASRDYLTIISTEIPTRGETTVVYGAFKQIFAPDGGGHHITISGFQIIGGTSDTGLCLESSGDFNTFAYNEVKDCDGTFGGIGIRVNEKNEGNNIHHNVVRCDCIDCDNEGIKIEGGTGGKDHNVAHNLVTGPWQESIIVYSKNTNVHHNMTAGADDDGIQIREGQNNKVNHNTACGGIEIFSNANRTQVQHNVTESLVDNGQNTKLNMNEVVSTCTLD